jgi:hypothetical protein
MRAELHTLLTDIKASARIGHAESLWVALDGVFDLPEVAGNPPMREAFIRQAILPIGEALTHPRVTAPTLRPLVNHSQAAIRAIAAAVFANQYCSGEKFSIKELAVFGRDPRKDVRLALVFALNQAGKQHPDKLLALAQSWITGESPRLVAVALQLLPSLAELNASKVVELLAAFQPSSDPEVRSSLVDCLVELAQGELSDEVLSLLEKWGASPEDYLWVLGKVLSRSWAVAHIDRSLEILTLLAAQQGPEKILLKTLKAMRRHGADEAIAQIVHRWREDPNPNLQAIAEQIPEK